MQPSRFATAAAVVAGALIVSALASMGTADVHAQAPGAQIFDGVFTAAQAERGKAKFEENCGSCHRADLTGAAAPALKGDGFLKKWEFQGLNALVGKVFDTMPQGYATNVQENVKVDIVSYILQANGFPAGREELSGDLELLQAVQILAKPNASQSLDSIPNYSLIQVVGCLSKAGDGGWQVSGAPDPSRATNPDASPSTALDRLKGLPTGSTSFRLINAGRLGPDAMAGRRVETKGFLYQNGDEKLLSVSALQTLGVACQP